MVPNVHGHMVRTSTEQLKSMSGAHGKGGKAGKRAADDSLMGRKRVVSESPSLALKDHSKASL